MDDMLKDTRGPEGKLAAFMKSFAALTEEEKLQSVEVLYGNSQARKRMLNH